MWRGNKRERTIWQFVIVKSKWTSVFHASVLLLTMNFVITLSVIVVCGSTRLSPRGSTTTLIMIVMMKFTINNRTDAWKTDIKSVNFHTKASYLQVFQLFLRLTQPPLIDAAIAESNLASTDSLNLHCFSFPTFFHLMALSSLTFLTTDRTQSI